MSPSFPNPGPSHDVKALFLTYFDFYRETVAGKVFGLTEADVRSTCLPSGWSPIELVKHLVFMERRWLVWGFLGEDVDNPWGDDRDGRWHVESDEPMSALLAALQEGGSRTRRIVEATQLSTPSAPGGRFAEDTERPSLAAILFHVLQEYARHTGHLDTVRELIDGQVGE
jgi:uncharacterized damage-inducible protein DinB